MKRILVLIAGVGASVLGYLYFRRNDGNLPSLEELGQKGQKLSEQGQQQVSEYLDQLGKHARKIQESLSGAVSEHAEPVADVAAHSHK